MIRRLIPFMIATLLAGNTAGEAPSKSVRLRFSLSGDFNPDKDTVLVCPYIAKKHQIVGMDVAEFEVRTGFTFTPPSKPQSIPQEGKPVAPPGKVLKAASE
jgi:hypothetical protein